MALTQITAADLVGKGVIGQPDVPGLPTAQMQAKVEEIVRDVVIPTVNANSTAQDAINLQILRKDNTDAWTPTTDYHPATKKYIDDLALSAGAVVSVFGRAGAILPTTGDYNGSQIPLNGYVIAGGQTPISASDTVNSALGKLEKGVNDKASNVHASEHATGGSDVLTPADIGAQDVETWASSSDASITVADGGHYTISSAGTLVIAAPAGNYSAWIKITFNSGSTLAVTFPTGTQFLGKVPTWTLNTTYEISYVNGVAAIAEVGDGT